MTAFGPWVGLWAYSGGGGNAPSLIPFFPLEGEGRHSHLDLKDNHREIYEALEFIKQNPIPTADVLEAWRAMKGA